MEDKVKSQSVKIQKILDKLVKLDGRKQIKQTNVKKMKSKKLKLKISKLFLMILM